MCVGSCVCIYVLYATQSYSPLPYSVLFSSTLIGQGRARHSRVGQGLSFPIPPCPTLPCHTLLCPALPFPTLLCPALLSPVLYALPSFVLPHLSLPRSPPSSALLYSTLCCSTFPFSTSPCSTPFCPTLPHLSSLSCSALFLPCCALPWWPSSAFLYSSLLDHSKSTIDVHFSLNRRWYPWKRRSAKSKALTWKRTCRTKSDSGLLSVGEQNLQYCFISCIVHWTVGFCQV